MCGCNCSSPGLLTKLSGSRDSWPRNKSRVVSFPSGLEWTLVTKSSRNGREDTQEDLNRDYKGPHTWGDTQIYAMSRTLVSHPIALKTSLQPEQLNMLYWENDLSLCVNVSALLLWLSNKYVRSFAGRNNSQLPIWIGLGESSKGFFPAYHTDAVMQELNKKSQGKAQGLAK